MASRYQKERYPIGSYIFSVTIGNKTIGFSRVNGIDFTKDSTCVKMLKKKSEISYISGSVLDSTNIGNPERKRSHTLTLEKAFLPCRDENESDQDFIKKYMKVNTQIEQITIKVMDADGSVALTLKFNDCFIASYSLSELDANKTGYLTQHIGIRYQSVEMN